ncbi:DMT family transporter [Primorskyibacter sp. S187A]|uniref:DMT family transporter n=1 Tax=Primorskyibacter sp. S187A TaxID=3415130 RepID=UPI003C7DDDFC
MTPSHDQSARLGILFILAGVVAISINDLLIKSLSGEYPLHQLVFTRATIGILFSLVFVKMEGGFHLLKTQTPGLHALRGFLVIIANMTFYAAVAVMPLAQATALFFVAPLFITLLSIPFLGERVGPMRLGAVVVGFVGVVVMQQPWSAEPLAAGRMALLLPVAAALTYALMQVMTRRLGAKAAASAMAVYIQGMFLCVSGIFYLIAGDGRFAEGSTNESVQFLLRAWVFPPMSDWTTFLGLGLCSGLIGYCLSAAYKVANAATIAPYEYAGLPLAIFWGWVIFGEWPDGATWIGCALIVGAGLFVFIREQRRHSTPNGWRRRSMRR